MDYELQIKVKNAPMLNRMREAGIYTAAHLSRETGVSQQNIGEMLALKIPLYCKARKRYTIDGMGERLGDMKPRPRAVKIAEFLGCSPEDLYPQSHWFSELEQSEFSAQLSREQMESLTHYSTGDPAAMLEYLEEDASLDASEMIDSVPNMTTRESIILKLRFEEGKTLREVAETIGITQERVRQIEAKALRKMRHPSVVKRLEKHLQTLGIPID